MIKLDISVSEEMSPFPQVSFSTPLNNPKSTDEGDVLTDLEALWGENRDCFETILNTTATSDCDSDYSDSSVSRLSAKPLVSKLAPIGETFSRNHLNAEPSVSNTLGMVNAPNQYLTEEETMSSPRKMENVASDYLTPEVTSSLNCHCSNEKQTDYFTSISNDFENSKISSITTSVCESKQNYLPLNFSLKNGFPSQFTVNSKEQNFAPYENSEQSNIKLKLGCPDNHPLTIGGLVTPPVSPEEDPCSRNSNRAPVFPGFHRLPYQLSSTEMSFFGDNSNPNQSQVYLNNPASNSYQYPFPNHLPNYYHFQNEQNTLETKIKTESTFSLPESSPNHHVNPIQMSREQLSMPLGCDHSTYQFSHHQHLLQSHQNWEDKSIPNPNSLLKGQNPEMFLQKVTVHP